MFELVGLFLVTALSVAIPVVGILRRRISITSDCVFLILYAQIIVYLHLAPTLWAVDLGADVRSSYLYLQTASLLLFELPALWMYVKLSRRNGRTGPPYPHDVPLIVNGRRQLLLALGTATLSVAFYYVATSQGIFFMRIGYGEAVSALLNLSLPEFVAYRLFALAGAFLICVLIASLLIERRTGSVRRHRKLVTALTVGVCGVFLLYEAFNSRLFIVMALLFIAAVFMLIGGWRPRSLTGVLVGSVLVLAAWYGYHIALNARNVLGTGSFRSAIFNPFLSWDVPDEANDWRFRLNGIDLMARITPAARREGFAMGAAWKGFAVILIGQVTLGSVVSSSEVADYKADFAGSPKKYLMDRYLGLDLVDYSSCLLTDLYGNFGLVGFPVGAVVVSVLCAFVRRGMNVCASPLLLIVALYITFHLLSFEQEFAVLVSSCVNTLPAFLFVVLLNPFERNVRPQEFLPQKRLQVV